MHYHGYCDNLTGILGVVEKRCGTCRETLPISQFRINPNSPSGLTSRCIRCANRAETVSYLKLKMEAIEHLGGCCSRCGFNSDHRALAIDHVNGGGSNARRSGIIGRRLLRAVFSDMTRAYQLLCYNCNTVKRVEDDECGNRTYMRVAPLANTDKWCPRCSMVKPAAEFYRNVARGDGLSSYCCTCMTTSLRNSYKALRARAVTYLGGRCALCAYDADPRALVLDHINGGGGAERRGGMTTRAPLNAIFAGSSDYQLLCANCNQTKQFENGERVGKRVYVRTIPTKINSPTR